MAEHKFHSSYPSRHANRGTRVTHFEYLWLSCGPVSISKPVSQERTASCVHLTFWAVPMALRHLQLLVWHQDRIVCYIGITTLLCSDSSVPIFPDCICREQCQLNSAFYAFLLVLGLGVSYAHWLTHFTSG